jgi:hypothetical protein
LLIKEKQKKNHSGVEITFVAGCDAESQVQPTGSLNVESQQFEEGRPADHRARREGPGRAERDPAIAIHAFGQR